MAEAYSSLVAYIWTTIILLAVSIISHIFPSIRIHTDDTSPSAKDQHVLEFQISHDMSLVDGLWLKSKQTLMDVKKTR